MKILAITLARGGSKGVPKKNIKLLNNKPLIAYTIDEAKKSKLIDKYIVSTDCNEIKETAASFGADVPFLRDKSIEIKNTLKNFHNIECSSPVDVFSGLRQWKDSF